VFYNIWQIVVSMRLLVILPRFPYPIEKGDKLRAYHQLRILSLHHQIHLVALSHQKVDDQDKAKVSPYCETIDIVRTGWLCMGFNLLKVLLSGLPFQVGYYYSAKARKQVDMVVKSFKPEHIYCQLLRTAEYGYSYNIPATLDYQDVFSKGVERRMPKVKGVMKYLLRMEYKRLLRYERAIFDKFDHKTIISVPDREQIPHPDRGEIVVVPNGVDHAYFKPMDKPVTHELVFTGNMGYPPNINCAVYLGEQVLPLIHKILPGVRLMIAGATPHAKVKALASEHITVTGWVDDMRECYAGAKIFLAPMLMGTGLQNKLLEAMSMQLPCITSTLCNLALKAEAGAEILIGDSPDQVAEQVLLLLQNQEFANKVARAGYDFVHQHYGWEGATQGLLKVIESKQ
jgi:sugar transferase (PEP-CTERM/EpsH1 system associated)